MACEKNKKPDCIIAEDTGNLRLRNEKQATKLFSKFKTGSCLANTNLFPEKWSLTK